MKARSKGIQGRDALGKAVFVCFECGKEQRIDAVIGDNKVNLCNYHFRLHKKFLKSQDKSSDVTVLKKEMIEDDDCQKGYPIELNFDNLSMASTVATTAPYGETSNDHKLFGVPFKLKNDTTTYV